MRRRPAYHAGNTKTNCYPHTSTESHNPINVRVGSTAAVGTPSMASPLSGVNRSPCLEGRSIKPFEFNTAGITFPAPYHRYGRVRYSSRGWGGALETEMKRQDTKLEPTSPRLNAKPIAKDIFKLIIDDINDERLNWSPDRMQVTVRIGKIIPGGGYPKAVFGGRRRFRMALESELSKNGWEPVRGTVSNTYRRD